ncbi:Uncharacterised protein [Mycobacteroides abscessus subsp. abscessus]|nr:Uncharacterised protein [Mycobacteroides abscessus subsp. abscessus]
MTCESFCGFLSLAESSAYVSSTAWSSRGMAHSSSLAGLPETVATSIPKPAAFRWCNGSSISTGWFPVENMVSFCMSM